VITRGHLSYPAHLQLATLKLAKGRVPAEIGLKRWKITDHSEVLGHGREAFEAASEKLLGWQAHAHAGVRARRRGKLVRLHYGPTTYSCLIIREERTPTRTLLVYGTLPAHVESGEEAFLIEMAADGTVTGRVVAFSRHSWWLAKIAGPVARWMQRRANRRYVAGMRP